MTEKERLKWELSQAEKAVANLKSRILDLERRECEHAKRYAYTNSRHSESYDPHYHPGKTCPSCGGFNYCVTGFC